MDPTTAAPESADARARAAVRTHRDFFALVRALGRLRVIHQSGPSTFEALCELGPHGFADGWMNAICPDYHWHLKLDGFGHVRSRDQAHARSGRRVLFFELRESAASKPFAFIYLHREKGEQLEPEREQAFLRAHEQLAEGAALREPRS